MHHDRRELRQPLEQVGALLDRRPGRPLGLGQCGGRAAHLGGGQCRAGDGPERLRRRQLGDQLGGCEEVADPQPGQPPGLGQAAQHHDPAREFTDGCQRFGLARERVHERLVDHQRPAGPGQRGEIGGGVDDGGRVGGVADDHQIRVGRHGVRREPEAVVRREQGAVDGVSGVPQRGLGFGELRVHDGRVPWPEGTGQQDERLRRTRGQQHLVHGPPVPRGDGGPRGRALWVGGEAGEGRGEVLAQPGGGSAGPYVDREVHQLHRAVAVADFGVAVVAQVGLGGRHVGTPGWAGTGYRDGGTRGLVLADDQLPAVTGTEQRGRLRDARRPNGGQ